MCRYAPPRGDWIAAVADSRIEGHSYPVAAGFIIFLSSGFVSTALGSRGRYKMSEKPHGEW